MAVPQFIGNSVSEGFNATTKGLEDGRARRMERERADIEFEQAQRKAETDRQIDTAIREAYAPAATSPAVQPAAEIPVQGVGPAAQPVQSTIVAENIPPATSRGLTAAPASAAVAPAQPGTTTQLSPFDTPQFNADLQRKLATIPGAGAQLMAMKKERDTQISKILEMASNGDIDVARHLAQQNGLQIPEQFYQNGDLARAVSLSSKAYPDEPDKGQVFFQTYIETPGSMQEKMNAGLNAAGRPTPASVRTLQNAMALAQYKDELKKKASTGAAIPATAGFAGGLSNAALYNHDDAVMNRQEFANDTKVGNDNLKKARELSKQASELKPALTQMQDASKNTYTGPWSGLVNSANWGLSFISDDAARRYADYQTLESGSVDMARGERQPGEGATSDFDARSFQRIVPGVDKSELFNEQAIRVRNVAADLATQKPAFLEEFRRRNGNSRGADEAWSMYVNDPNGGQILSTKFNPADEKTFLNPNFTDWQSYFGLNGAAQGGGETPQAGAVTPQTPPQAAGMPPQATQAKVINGVTYYLVNGQWMQ
jgi:hypothetical protein